MAMQSSRDNSSVSNESIETHKQNKGVLGNQSLILIDDVERVGEAVLELKSVVKSRQPYFYETQHTDTLKS